MKRNKKFLVVKSPLDFWSNEDLARWSSNEYLYSIPWEDVCEEYASIGRRIRRVLSYTPSGSSLAPAPFEVSDSVLKILSAIWDLGDEQELSVEVFFLPFLVEALFENWDPLPPLLEGLDSDSIEQRVLQSSLAVVLGLLLGVLGLHELRAIQHHFLPTGSSDNRSEFQDIVELVQGMELRPETRFFTLPLRSQKTRVGQKVCARLKRVRDQFARIQKQRRSTQDLLRLLREMEEIAS
jgi:hypothetical protein